MEDVVIREPEDQADHLAAASKAMRVAANTLAGDDRLGRSLLSVAAVVDLRIGRNRLRIVDREAS